MLHCSFCGKPGSEKSIEVMIKSKDAVICDNCVALCITAIARYSNKTIAMLEATIHSIEIGE